MRTATSRGGIPSSPLSGTPSCLPGGTRWFLPSATPSSPISETPSNRRPSAASPPPVPPSSVRPRPRRHPPRHPPLDTTRPRRRHPNVSRTQSPLAGAPAASASPSCPRGCRSTRARSATSLPGPTRSSTASPRPPRRPARSPRSRLRPRRVRSRRRRCITPHSRRTSRRVRRARPCPHGASPRAHPPGASPQPHHRGASRRRCRRGASPLLPHVSPRSLRGMCPRLRRQRRCRLSNPLPLHSRGARTPVPPYRQPRTRLSARHLHLP